MKKIKDAKEKIEDMFRKFDLTCRSGKAWELKRELEDLFVNLVDADGVVDFCAAEAEKFLKGAPGNSAEAVAEHIRSVKKFIFCESDPDNELYCLRHKCEPSFTCEVDGCPHCDLRKEGDGE